MRQICALSVLFLAASCCGSWLQSGEGEEVRVLFVDVADGGDKQLELERAVLLASDHVNANASCLLDGRKLHISIRSAQVKLQLNYHMVVVRR